MTMEFEDFRKKYEKAQEQAQRVREVGKASWVRELEKMRKKAEDEEANKDALSYLKAGLAKLDHFFSGQ
ncbi:Potassium-transporting ATPase ATP-binding subunit [Labeo rohita]|uniref:Potassium-transporting ATPase ATP-binding subunit n=1 Tax=Labeo rohita TaxID=84645 RepID=A0ABQ8LB23_LABRO|nr:Potassium-transporting ATPase ATP-binding subunit [Labeo rohita]